MNLKEISQKNQKFYPGCNLLIIIRFFEQRFFGLKERYCGCIVQPITGVQACLRLLHCLLFNKQTETPAI